jgi:hypothetical protein
MEPCWSKIKTFLRSAAARTVETLNTEFVNAVASVTSQEARAWFLHGGDSRPNGAVSKRRSRRKPQDRKLPLTRLDQAKSSIDTDDDLSASSPESCSVCVSCISSRLESARRMMKRLSDPTFLLADRSKIDEV